MLTFPPTVKECNEGSRADRVKHVLPITGKRCADPQPTPSTQMKGNTDPGGLWVRDRGWKAGCNLSWEDTVRTKAGQGGGGVLWTVGVSWAGCGGLLGWHPQPLQSWSVLWISREDSTRQKNGELPVRTSKSSLFYLFIFKLILGCAGSS